MTNLYNYGAPEFAGSAGRSTLTAFFDNRGDAERAVARLKDAGIADSAIRFMPGYEADDDAATSASDDRRGFWATLEDWLFPDEDRATYAEGLRRGGFLLSVQVDDASYDNVHEILDDEGSIDMDERADAWRTEGWEAGRSNEAYATSTYDASPKPVAPNVIAQPDVAGREDTFDGPREETIPVIEENLRVGKRDVNRGSVRVRAYSVGQPAQDDVSLSEKNDDIEHRADDGEHNQEGRLFQSQNWTGQRQEKDSGRQ